MMVKGWVQKVRWKRKKSAPPPVLQKIVLFIHTCMQSFYLRKSVSYMSSSGQYFTPICLSMTALKAQPRWPLYRLTFRNIFLFPTRLFYSLRNEGKDTRLKGKSRRLAPSSHPSTLWQRSFRPRHRAPPTDCNVEVMPISLATWVLIVTFHYGQWQRGDPQAHLEEVTQGPMRRRQNRSDLEMSEHCAWVDTQILHEPGRSSTSKTPCCLSDMLLVKK